MNRSDKDWAEEALSLACALQAIPAPTFHEGPRADYLTQYFHTLGLEDVHKDAAGNVLGRLPGRKNSTARPLVVTAHMDTVHPLDIPLKTRRTAERIHGAGIGDNALGLAAMLVTARMLREQSEPLPGDLWLVANVCEEGLGDLRGIRAVVDRFEGQPLAYIVVEGMGLGTVLHRGLGVERYKISVQTPGGHSWVDYGQPSAIHELSALVTKLAAIELPLTPCTTLNVGVIQGGTSINTIAAQAVLELDLRSEDSAALAQLVKTVRSLAQAARRENVHVKIERIGKREAGQLPEDHPLVVFASQVISGLGIEPHRVIGSTDANLPLSRGYPAVCVGITNGSNAHTVDEYILTQPTGKGLTQLYRLVTRAWDHLSEKTT